LPLFIYSTCLWFTYLYLHIYISVELILFYYICALTSYTIKTLKLIWLQYRSIVTKKYHCQSVLCV
jgi:hypothetical protein